MATARRQQGDIQPIDNIWPFDLIFANPAARQSLILSENARLEAGESLTVAHHFPICVCSETKLDKYHGKV